MDGTTPSRQQGELARDESSQSRAPQIALLGAALRLYYVASCGGCAVFAGRTCSGGDGRVTVAADALAPGLGRQFDSRMGFDQAGGLSGVAHLARHADDFLCHLGSPAERAGQPHSSRATAGHSSIPQRQKRRPHRSWHGIALVERSFCVVHPVRVVGVAIHTVSSRRRSHLRLDQLSAPQLKLRWPDRDKATAWMDG